MNTTGIHRGDIVELDVRGWQAFVRVAKPIHKDEHSKRRVLTVEPLKPNGPVPTRFPTARQVVGHYSKRKGSR